MIDSPFLATRLEAAACAEAETELAERRYQGWLRRSAEARAARDARPHGHMFSLNWLGMCPSCGLYRNNHKPDCEACADGFVPRGHTVLTSITTQEG